MEDMTVRRTCLIEVKMSQIYRGELHGENIFAFFFVLMNFQLSAKHFSVLPCYFMKQEDSLEKR